ncbi:MAG TPA: ABC transporter permease [Chloroflexia bacterium]|nr:ABC transporter permease [Chloroflexia bacterium]
MAAPLTGHPITGATAEVTAAVVAPRRASRWGAVLPPAVMIGAVLLLWEAVAYLRLQGLEEGTLAYKQENSVPYAHKVLQAYAENAGSFLAAGLVTLGNALVGFLIGAVVGYGLALLMARAAWLERSFYGYIVGSQMVPVIALAPILYGIIHDETILKITVAAYLTFFPVTVNVLKGLRSVDPRALDLMHSYAATPGEIYRKLRIPAALPFLFNALKIASTGSLIGAIVSELMGGSAGIGVLLIQLQYSSFGQTEKLWALILETAAIGILFFLAVSLVERLVVPWQPEFRRQRGTAG